MQKRFNFLTAVNSLTVKVGGGREEVRRLESEVFQGLCPVLPVRWPPLAACCFARGLWEVLLLRGQAGAPPSSCFDRHRALAHSHRRFPCSARCCGFSRERKKKKIKTGPLLRRYKTAAALCSATASVMSRLASTPKDPFTVVLKRDSFFFYSLLFISQAECL